MQPPFGGARRLRRPDNDTDNSYIECRRRSYPAEACGAFARGAQNMTAPTAAVIRDGKETIIPASKLVRGDIIEVRAGDLVPADARLITSHSLFAQESALTGESVPCERTRGQQSKGQRAGRNKKYDILVYRHNCGSRPSRSDRDGHGHGGRKIAHLLNTEDEPTTPLQIKLAKIGKALGIGALSVCALIFMLSILRGMGVLSAFMLSVSLAVAAIPEGLPAVVTVVLSLGVQRMAKSNAVIRRLPAVETLGAATYICSDKTGTLTQNKMTVTAACSASDEIPLTGDAAKSFCSRRALLRRKVYGQGRGLRRADGGGDSRGGREVGHGHRKAPPKNAANRRSPVLIRAKNDVCRNKRRG